MAKKVYVKPGGKATGKMKDYAIGSKERYNEYNERGWKQDRTSSGGGMTDVKKIGVAGVAAPGSIKMTGPTAGEKIAASKPTAAVAAAKAKQNVKDTKNQKKTVKAINKATKNIKKTDKGQTGTVENKEGQTSTAKQRMQLKAGARMLKNNLNAAAKKQNKETKKQEKPAKVKNKKNATTVSTVNQKNEINYGGM